MEIKNMITRQSLSGPLSFRSLRGFIVSDREASEELQPITNREFLSVLSMLIVGLLLLAVTIGPLKIL